MIDNNQQDDEYQFADLDSMTPEMEDENREFGQSGATNPSPEQAPKKDIRRNAIIAITLVVLAMVLYKFVGSLFHKDVAAVESSKQKTAILQPAPIQPAPIQAVQEQPAPVVSTTPDVSGMTQKLSDMEASQQSLRADFNGLNNQLSTVNDNITALNSKLAALTESLATLTNGMEQQSAELAKIVARQAKPKRIHVTQSRIYAPRIQYAIQAIIPGRAWLIAQNGSTITVRVGTVVPMVGTVRVIDPNLGRVVMSTGQVIRFSQQDS